jgi:hypothetical protein
MYIPMTLCINRSLCFGNQHSPFNLDEMEKSYVATNRTVDCKIGTLFTDVDPLPTLTFMYMIWFQCVVFATLHGADLFVFICL